MPTIQIMDHAKLLAAIQGPDLNMHFVLVLIALAISVLVPWLEVIQRCRFYVILLPAALATIFWQGFEFYQTLLFPVGDPLMHLPRLVLIYPLLAVTWISTTLAMGTAIRRNNKQKRNRRKHATRRCFGNGESS